MTLLLPRIIVLLSRQIDDGPGKPKKACRMIAPIEALSFSTGPRRKAKQFAGDFSGGCQRRSGLWPGIYATRDICRPARLRAFVTGSDLAWRPSSW
jgi:hypothetical protein